MELICGNAYYCYKITKNTWEKLNTKSIKIPPIEISIPKLTTKKIDISPINNNYNIKNVIVDIINSINDNAEYINDPITILYTDPMNIINDDYIYNSIIYKLLVDIRNKSGHYDNDKLKKMINNNINNIPDIESQLKLFEFFSSIFIRKNQYEIIKNIYNTDINGTKYFHQLLMGLGKSSVIMPCVTILLNAKSNVTIVVPETLVHEMYNIIFKKCGYMTTNNIKKYNISRNSDVTMDDKQINIMSDLSLKSFLLNNINKKNDLGFVLYDEIDKIMDPITNELNYSLESKKIYRYGNDIYKISKTLMDNLECECKMMDCIKVTQEPHFSITQINVNKCNIIGLEKEYKTDTIIKSFLCYNILTRVESKYKTIITKYFKDSKEFVYYVLDNRNDITILDDDIEIMKIIIKLVVSIIFSATEKICRKNYGMITKRNNVKCYFSILYIADNVPSKSSEFSDPYFLIVYTYLCYKYYGLTNDDIFELLGYLYSNYATNKQLFTDKIEKINDIFDMKRKPSLKDIDDKLEYIKNDSFLIDEYMLYICENKLSIYMKHINCSTYDILSSSFTKLKSGFTGTPFLPYIIDITDNDISNTVRGNESFKKINDNILTGNIKYISSLNILENIVEKIFENDYRSLIDASSFLIKYDKPKNVASYIVDKVNGHKNSTIKYVIYISSSNKIKYMDLHKNTKYYYNDILPLDTIFVYYDQRHTTGVDIVQSSNIKGLVTCKTTTRYRDMAQSMYRLRELDNGQKVIFLVFHEDKTILKTTNDILEKLNINEVKYGTLQETTAKIQNCITLIRNYTKDKKYYKIINEQYYKNKHDTYNYIKSNNHIKEIETIKTYVDTIFKTNENAIKKITERLNYKSEINVFVETQNVLQVEQEIEQESQNENIYSFYDNKYNLENIMIEKYYKHDFSDKYGDIYLSSRFDQLLCNNPMPINYGIYLQNNDESNYIIIVTSHKKD